MSADTALVLFACSGCGVQLTAMQFGKRRDGRPNTRCPDCRSTQAAAAGRIGSVRARSMEQPRDVKALRVVERYVGMKWKEWCTRAGREAQERYLMRQGYSALDAWRMRARPFEELWTRRIEKLAERAERCRAARARIAARDASILLVSVAAA